MESFKKKIFWEYILSFELRFAYNAGKHFFKGINIRKLSDVYAYNTIYQ